MHGAREVLSKETAVLRTRSFGTTIMGSAGTNVLFPLTFGAADTATVQLREE